MHRLLQTVNWINSAWLFKKTEKPQKPNQTKQTTNDK